MPFRSGARAWLVAAVALAFSAGARAADGPAAAGAAPRFGATARLLLAPGTRTACLLHEPDPFTGPTNPGCRAAAGERLDEAFQEVVARLFRAPPAGRPADLEITVTLLDTSVASVTGLHGVVLDAQVVARAPPATALMTAVARGESPVVGDGASAVPAATASAARDAAHRFETQLLTAAAFERWVAARGLDGAAPERGRWVAFLDLGGGVVAGGGEASAGAVTLQGGVANRWFFVQGVGGLWETGFESSPIAIAPQHRAADLSALDVGLEAGPLLRFGTAGELRGGAGVHLLWGEARAAPLGDPPAAPSPFTRVVPSFFAAVQAAPRFRLHVNRPRLGLVVRHFAGTAVDLPALSRRIPVADTYVGAFLGFELPWAAPSSVGSAP